MPTGIFFHGNCSMLISLHDMVPSIMVLGTRLYLAIVSTTQDVRQNRVPLVGSSPISGFARTLPHPYLLPSYLDWGWYIT